MRSPSENLVESRYEYAVRSIFRLRSRLPARLVLDIGAGAGVMQQKIEAMDCEWKGFDVAPAVPHVERWNLEQTSPVPSSVAGAILLLDVLEHLENPGFALAAAHEALRTGGFLVITAPNPRWSWSRIHALRSGVPACFTELDLELNGHVFTPWPHILMKMLSNAGFETEEYVTLDGKTGWPGRPVSLRYPLRLLHAALNAAIEKFDRSACGMTFGLVARRVSK